MWRAICFSGDTSRTLFPHPLFTYTAYADACADASCAGLGGYVRLPDDSCGCFQALFTPSVLHELASWFPASGSPQHFIATWELLAQLGLLWTLISVLPVGHMPIHVVFQTDNSATESASWKGLSMAKGMGHVLQAFFHLQERNHVSVHLDAVPGFLNHTAEYVQISCAEWLSSVGVWPFPLRVELLNILWISGQRCFRLLSVWQSRLLLPSVSPTSDT